MCQVKSVNHFFFADKFAIKKIAGEKGKGAREGRSAKLIECDDAHQKVGWAACRNYSLIRT